MFMEAGLDEDEVISSSSRELKKVYFIEILLIPPVSIGIISIATCLFLGDDDCLIAEWEYKSDS